MRAALRGRGNRNSERIKSGEFRRYYEQQYGERLRAAI
jgi:hypothetical protein